MQGITSLSPITKLPPTKVLILFEFVSCDDRALLLGDTKAVEGSNHGNKSWGADDEDEEDKGARKSIGGGVGAHVKRSDGMEMEVTFVSGEKLVLCDISVSGLYMGYWDIF